MSASLSPTRSSAAANPPRSDRVLGSETKTLIIMVLVWHKQGGETHSVLLRRPASALIGHDAINMEHPTIEERREQKPRRLSQREGSWNCQSRALRSARPPCAKKIAPSLLLLFLDPIHDFLLRIDPNHESCG